MESFCLSPQDVFRKLYSQPYSFWLDNCGLSRYSFAGADPFVIIKAQNNKVEIIQDSNYRIVTGNVFSILTSLLNKFKTIHHEPPCFPFQGGAVGYFGYDLKNQIERLPKKKTVPPILPDSIFGLYDTIFVYDHKTNKGYVVSSGLAEKGNKQKRLRGKKRIGQFLDSIKSPVSLSAPLFHSSAPDMRKIKSNFTKDAYINAIKQVQRYIASGDIYQANLSQRLTIDFKGDPLSFYSRLRRINPAQFGTFLNYGDFQIISNSPERLLKIYDDVAETGPIKGTKPRGKNPEDDKIFIKELKTSHKELAEHIMIVDLERNDLGKICKYGSIKVKPLQKVHTYETLHHMVSTVRGKVRENISPVDCLKSCFPGGSVTGAPKIRAMEIIEELEPTPRGIYTGAIGYIDFSGNMDMSMAIRTGVIKDKQLYLSVGGGIVADSKPEEEYKETMLKASAFLKTIIKAGGRK